MSLGPSTAWSYFLFLLCFQIAEAMHLASLLLLPTHLPQHAPQCEPEERLLSAGLCSEEMELIERPCFTLFGHKYQD